MQCSIRIRVWHACAGKKNISKAWAAAHHLLLGHGLVMKAYREEKYTQPIGISLNVATPRPATRRAEDAEAVDRFMDLATYMFLNPLLASHIHKDILMRILKPHHHLYTMVI